MELAEVARGEEACAQQAPPITCASGELADTEAMTGGPHVCIQRPGTRAARRVLRSVSQNVVWR